MLATDLDAFSCLALQTRQTLLKLLKLPNVKDLHASYSLGEVKAGVALPLTHLAHAGGDDGRGARR